jgi:5-methylcytosine-specific restriction enzyme A
MGGFMGWVYKTTLRRTVQSEQPLRKTASRNPTWTRDELILAMDLYISRGRSQLSSDDPEVISLSDVLNQLPVHEEHDRKEKFRNPNGVSMKLGNFLSLDPDYPGAGLTRGGRLEREVWDEFITDPERLERTAKAIREGITTLANHSLEVEEEFSEGRVLTSVHKQRERNRVAVSRKKQVVLKQTGALRCEVCGFDFALVYGELGFGFAECHHTIPLSDLGEVRTTRLSDLAIVCANCHRMLHRGSHILTIEELRQILETYSI